MKKINKLFTGSLLIGLIGFMRAGPALPAQTEGVGKTKIEKKTQIEEIEKEKEEKSEVRQKKAEVIAQQYNVSATTVLDLREKKLGWGEIAHLLAISAKSGQSIDTVLQLRQSGMGWGKIAQKYNLKLGEIKKESVTMKKAGGENKLNQQEDRNLPHERREKIDRDFPKEMKFYKWEKMEKRGLIERRKFNR